MGLFTSNSARRDGYVTLPQLLTALVSFIALSLIGGFLVAGLVLPVATVGGTAVTATGEVFEELPAELQDVYLAQQSNIYDRTGENLLATFYAQNRVVVPLGRISRAMQDAVVAVEDKRFWSHHGVDGEGLLRAAYVNITSPDSPGASTLTQQVIKNTLLQAAENADDDEAREAATEVSLTRKVREWRLALFFEESLEETLGTDCNRNNQEVDCGKEQVLEQYLNIAQFGPNTYGVEAAAQFYFSKPASKLSVIEAATIAGITQNPSLHDPSRNPDNGEFRRNTVLLTMFEQGMITRAEYDDYRLTPIEDTLNISYPKLSCAASAAAPFFCDYVTKIITRDDVFNQEGSDLKGYELLQRGGLDIITTLDLDKQRAANEELVKTLPMDDPNGFAMAMVALDSTNGEILSMAQNRVFDPASEAPNSTAINYAVDQAYGGSRGFSPGSTFKPIILAEWLNSGRPLMQTVSANTREWDLNTFTACGGPYGSTAKWKPGNVLGREVSQLTVLDATAQSINTAFVSMSNQLDLCGIRDMSDRLGFQRADGLEFEVVPSATLGTQNASPLTMATVMQTFANRGVRCTPVAILSITDADGNDIEVPPYDCIQTIPEDVADGVSWAMQEVMKTGSGRREALDDNRPSAGKTGTSQLNAHTWFAGFTPEITSVFWLGHPDRDVPMRNMTIGGVYAEEFYGSTLAFPTWIRFMNRALEGVPVSQLPTPTDEILNGVPIRIPDVSGLTESEARYVLNDAGFRLAVSEQLLFSDQYEPGTVATQSPGAGSTLLPGGAVEVVLATDTLPEWWFNWPSGWDPLLPPEDWWGDQWPPAEFAVSPPSGWSVQCSDGDPYNEDILQPCPGYDQNGNLIDQNGNLIDEDGNLIDQNGNLIDPSASNNGRGRGDN